MAALFGQLDHAERVFHQDRDWHLWLQHDDHEQDDRGNECQAVDPQIGRRNPLMPEGLPESVPI
jgi:hypothetical protein